MTDVGKLSKGAWRALAEHLEGIPWIIGLINGAIAALSATLIRARLIPENIDLIGPLGTLVVIVAFLTTVAYRESLGRWLRRLIAVALVCLTGLLLLQVTLVEEVSAYGSDQGTHHYLVGSCYSEQGREWLDVASIAATDRDELIRYVGDGDIPEAWGSSFYLAALLYVGAYLGFILCVVLALGAVGSDGRRDEQSDGRLLSRT